MSLDRTVTDEQVAAVDEWMARGDGEEILWRGTPRITTILPAVAIGVVLFALGVGGAVTQSQPLFFAAALFGVVVAVGAYLHVVNVRYVVTDDALYRKTGVLARRVERLSLHRVQNSAFTQGILGSLFDYGNVAVEAAGGGSIVFGDIDNPQAVRSLVERQVGGEELPGTLHQWQAVRDEVRRLRGAFDGQRR